MMDYQVAVISDVHGNIRALEAVLADINHRGIIEIINLGDSVYGPLEPKETANLLASLDIPTVCGNEDRIIIESPGDSSPSGTLRFVRECLNSEHIEWLKNLPFRATVDQHITLFHGTPLSDTDYLLQKVTPKGVLERDEGELKELLDGIASPVILCGHDHEPRTLRLGNQLIVNPGSVGLQAYRDDTPYPHRMETGSPHARYSIMTWKSLGWAVESISVAYNWEEAAATARRNGRADWAQWLMTGIA